MAYLNTADLDIGLIPINVKVKEVNPNLLIFKIIDF